MADQRRTGSFSRILHGERRGLFWFWVATTVVVFTYAMVASPFVHSLGLPPAAVAVTIPVLNILLLLTAALWMLHLVNATRRRKAERVQPARTERHASRTRTTAQS